MFRGRVNLGFHSHRLWCDELPVPDSFKPKHPDVVDFQHVDDSEVSSLELDRPERMTRADHTPSALGTEDSDMFVEEDAVAFERDVLQMQP